MQNFIFKMKQNRMLPLLLIVTLIIILSINIGELYLKNRKNKVTDETATKVETTSIVIEKMEETETSYSPMKEGWVVYKSISKILSKQQKSNLDTKINSWTAESMDDSELKSQIESYLKEQSQSYSGIIIVSNSYSLYHKIQEPEIEENTNVYTFSGTYSTGKKDSNSNNTICYNWSVFIL